MTENDYQGRHPVSTRSLRARSDKAHVVVVGGGLAGLAAALACVDGGARVTLLESRPRLGGATWSFQRNGLSFDNGQHVYLRCCGAYQRFLERVGSAHDAPLQERLSVPVLRPGAGAPIVSYIKRGHLPAPLHLGPSLLSYRHLGLGERLRLGRAVLALLRLSLDDPALDEESFGSFLARHGQSADAVDKLWDLITLPTVNVHAGEASLALAAKVFKTGLLSKADAADIGWSRIPLSRLHVEPAVQLLERAGARVKSRAKVDAVALAEEDASTSTGVQSEGEMLAADAVILAVPHEAAAELLPQGATLAADELLSLGYSPIVDVHLVYDRKVSDFPLAAGVDSPVQFVFDRTEAAGMSREDGQCLALSISAADKEIGERPEVLIERYSKAIVELFPRASKAKVLDAVVSRERHATFRGLPGTARARAATSTRIDNLFLAGAWTDTGWPATMEGAVRSGARAASQALGFLGQTRYRSDLPEEVPA